MVLFESKCRAATVAHVVRTALLRRALPIFACTAVACGVGACGRHQSADTAAPPAQAPAPAGHGADASAVVIPPPSGALPDETLFGRLAREAKNRPHITPSADEIFARFEQAGVRVPVKQQSMATTYGALYCVGGYDDDRSLAINVCEYADEAGAVAGRNQSTSLFPKMTTRQVWTHKATTLTIINLRPGKADIAAVEKKVVDAYLGA